MTKVNDLSNEVAQVASKLGFRTNHHSFTDRDFHPDSSTSRQNRSKSKPKRPVKKPSRKGDSYDKEALLRILSGPEEKSTVDLKRLRKARSILPKTGSVLWHEALEGLPKLGDEGQEKGELTAAEIDKKKQQASDLVQNEKDAYEYRMHSSKKHGRWLLQVKEKGTHSDRIASLSLQVRDAVIANLSEIDVLLNIAEKQKGSKELVITSLKALTELFRCYLLPNRKLVSFKTRPLHLLETDEESKIRLMYWFVEDSLKMKFSRLVSILESATVAPLDHLRSESVTLVSSLLYDRPEQEAQLLRILIHKLGDKTKKIASKVAFLLSKLMSKHPRMKPIVLREVEKFVYLPGTTIRSIQRVLQVFNLISYEHNSSDRQTAKQYITMCFTLFQLMIDGKIGSLLDLQHKAEMQTLSTGKGKKEVKMKTAKVDGVQEIDATIFNALIVGIRRSLPFSEKKELGSLLEKHLNGFFRMIHLAPVGVGIQILSLLFQISSAELQSMDRLYRALYEKILDPHLPHSRRLPLFISTLYKAMKEDPSLERCSSFVKRILQATHNAEPHIHCAFLLVISELYKFKPGLKHGILQSEQHGDRSYKIDSREPKYSGAEQSCVWELSSCLNHYHPVAAAMSRDLLSSQSLPSRGDPLQELTLFAFLKKFVAGKETKNKSLGIDGPTQITPGSVLFHRTIESKNLFSSLASQDVPVEDVFFHKYFNLHGVRKAKEVRSNAKKRKKGVVQRTAEEESDLGGSEGDLELMKESDAEEDVAMEDVDELFEVQTTPTKTRKESSKPAKELYDYSDLIQDVKEAYDDSLDDRMEDEKSGEDISLPTFEFPEMLCSSEESEFEDSFPLKKKRKRILESDFAPAEDFAEILNSEEEMSN